MSAQEQHREDDEERNRQRESAERANANQPPLVDDQGERQHPGGNPGDPGAAPAPGADEDTDVEPAKKHGDALLEHDSEIAG
jgi:hypothetical protein